MTSHARKVRPLMTWLEIRNLKRTSTCFYATLMTARAHAHSDGVTFATRTHRPIRLRGERGVILVPLSRVVIIIHNTTRCNYFENVCRRKHGSDRRRFWSWPTTVRVARYRRRYETGRQIDDRHRRLLNCRLSSVVRRRVAAVEQYAWTLVTWLLGAYIVLGRKKKSSIFKHSKLGYFTRTKPPVIEIAYTIDVWDIASKLWRTTYSFWTTKPG